VAGHDPRHQRHAHHHNDYAERDQTRFWLKMLLYLAAGFTILLGTLVIFTFDPNIG
jgi:succinate dehydrogenase / fumarate reductase membrane anchor subunit